jgi:hypothetical protein
MRAAVPNFLDAPPEDEVILITTGRQAGPRAADRPPKIKEAAAGLFTDGAGTVLMDGLLEIDDGFFKRADDRWPVLVIFTSDGTESAPAREKKFMKWSRCYGARGFTVHAFVMKTPRAACPTSCREPHEEHRRRTLRRDEHDHRAAGQDEGARRATGPRSRNMSVVRGGYPD